MSHKNVSDEESRGHYATPRWPVHTLLKTHGCLVCGTAAPVLPGGRWVEPCAGSGSIIYATNEVRVDVEWTAVEIDQELVEKHLWPARARGEIAHLEHADFFPWAAGYVAAGLPRFEVALMNPAFPDAAAFVEQCRNLAHWVIALERLDWLSGPHRLAFYSRVGEPDGWVLPNRPSFRGRGQDSGDYAWFVWGPTTSGRMHHLPAVSQSLRSENRDQLHLLPV